MIDTEDLSSYYSGYDEYCEPKETQEIYDNSDGLHDEFMLREESKNMKREIIDLEYTSLTVEDVYKLTDYVLRDYKLIPIELLEGE